MRLLPSAGRGLVAGAALLNILLGLLPVVFLVATSVLVGRVPAAVGEGLDSVAWERLTSMLLVAGVAIIGQMVLAPVQTALGELITRRVDGPVLERVMSASLSHPGLAMIEDQAVQNHLADASRELRHNSQSPGRACAGLLTLLARYVALAGCVIAVGVLFSWLAALAVAVTTMLFRYGQRGGLRKYAEVFPRLAPQRRESDYLRDLATGVGASKEIRVFGLVTWLSDRYRAAYASWLGPLWRERRRIYLAPYLGVSLLAVLLAAAVLGGLGADAAESLTLTRFALVTQAVLAAIRLGEYYPEADVPTQFGTNAYDALRRLESTAAAYPSPPTAPSGQRPAPTGTIRFEKVGFHYPGHPRMIFEGLDLTIAVGRCTAIVGLNGAGKTTLVKLLAKLYEPTAGAVLVDGVDLREVPAEDWRRQLSITFQDHLRYEMSAADNIGFGAVDHLDDRAGIAMAAEQAGVAEVLHALPNGLQTPLARELPGGTDLSGGQWQRVAIARALFALRCGASVLVLDEPTASLDVRAEARFYDEFVRLTEGVTTILISHRFSTVRLADHVVVLEDGQICEQGAPEALVRLGGRYAQLYHLQAARFADDGDADRDDAAQSGSFA